ncbi:MAG: NADH-quinone oxidoreductase subunit M [Acidimicrobiia bacterium]|nr:NADH-quinone oxidoreductase subunit M [Acidimicrobiia bacterium]
MGVALLAAEAAEAAVEFPVLPMLVAVPLLTVLVLLFLPPSRADYVKLTALVGSLITGAVSIYLLWNFTVGEAGFQFVSRYDWGGLGLSLFLGVDGISLFLVVLTGILFPVAILTTDPHHDPKPYYLWMMLLMAGSMGAFMALDLLLFFMFFEVVLVPMYFLIGGWGHDDRINSAMKFFLYTMAASALMLVGIASLAILAAPADGVTFDITVLAQHNLSSLASTLIFLSFALAFAVKVPLFPVHTWLPDAHTEAPTAGSVILAGVMLKLGTYGMLRFGVYLFPQVVSDLAPIFIGLGVVGIVYGAAVATMQSDLKRLVAYSSVAHMGFIVLGIFALNNQGLSGSVIQMVNHGISTGALFILVGWIYDRRHTRQISALGGLQKAAPVMAGVFTLVMLSSIGLPGLNGFVGEFLILLGAFSAARWWTVVAVSGVILAALYLLWAYQRSFHGPAEGDNATMRDLSVGELLGIMPLLGLIVFLGVYPKPVLDRIEPSVDLLIAHVESNVDGFAEAEPEQVTRAGAEGLVAEAEAAEEAGEEGAEGNGGAGAEEEGE